MILYTIYPPEVIFHREEEAPKRREVTLEGGVRLELTADADGQYRVNRLISTNPADYLDPRFQPGRLYQP